MAYESSVVCEPSVSYTQSSFSMNVFLGNEIKKGSEIKIPKVDIQHQLALSQEKHMALSQERQLSLSQNHQITSSQNELVAKNNELLMTKSHERQLSHTQSHSMPQSSLLNPAQSAPHSRMLSPTLSTPQSSSQSNLCSTMSSPQSSIPTPELVSSTSSKSAKRKSRPASTSDDHKLSQSDRGYICGTCFKGFRNKPQLTQHELVHNNVRKHECSYCEKTFKQVSHLNQHQRVHTGERPYKCDLEGCGRSFAQLSNLNHHKKNHEDHVRREVGRQYRCEVCERSYATKSSLNTHIQKLHLNLKSIQGSVSSPTSTTSQLPKRRKKASSVGGEYPDWEGMRSKLGFCDDDDDLPTQVKVKSSPGQKQSLSVRIGTPSIKSERDNDGQAQRTTLPVPFTKPFEHYHQNQDNFVSTFSNPIMQPEGQGQGQMSSSQQSHSFSNSENINKVSNMSHANPSQPVSELTLTSEASSIKYPQHTQHQPIPSPVITSHDLIQAEQRALMQIAVSQQESCHITSNIEQGQESHTRRSQNISQPQSVSTAPSLHQEHVLSSNSQPVFPSNSQSVFPSNPQSGSHGNHPDHVARETVRNEAPSHVTHHYAVSTENSHHVSSHSMFHSNFHNTNIGMNHNTFSHRQF